MAIFILKVSGQSASYRVSILGDNYGTIVHLGERDCSVQRRNQKLLENRLLLRLTLNCVEDGKLLFGLPAVSYTNAGTGEFLLNEDGILFYGNEYPYSVEHP